MSADRGAADAARPPAAADPLGFLSGGGVMGARMRAHDWAASPLGPPEQWPIGLKVPLRMMLSSRFEMWLGWGGDLRFFHNDAYRPTLGHKDAYALGRPMREVWAEVYADLEDQIRSVMQDGRPSWNEALLLLLERHGYPEETYHTFSYSPLHGDTGAVEGMMCVVREETERVISARRLATLGELATTLAPLRTHIEVARALSAVLAANGKDFPFSLLYRFNEAGTAILKGDAPTPAGLSEVPWPCDEILRGAESVRVALPEAVAAGVCGAWGVPPTAALLTPIHHVGRSAPRGVLVVGLNPYRPEDETILGFAQLVAGQVGAALANADAFEAQTRRADQVWRNSRDLLVVVGADGVFRSVNPAWTRILGHAREEVEGRSFLDFLLPDDAALTQDALDAAVADADLTDFENRFRHKDGSVRWISWSTSVEEDLVYAYGRDVTEVKERQAELARTQEALRQSQKMEAVGQLTGGIAHDFNNLLAGVSGSLELLEKRLAQGRPAGTERYIGAAQNSARRAAALTQRLLAFSRRQTLDPKPTDVNRLVAGMEELIRRTVGPDVEVEVVGAGGLWPTRIDPSQLENALLNLCINARDAMAPYGGRLTIETANKWLDERAAEARDLPPGQYVSLCVTDTGVGMTPEVAARAFEPFFTTKPLGEGTGLGLSMIYGFVRQSGGQVRIYSEPGRGSTMCLYLPRHLGAAEVPEPPPRAIPPDPGDGETVLVIDDEPTLRMLITEVLEEAGYAAIEAPDGPSGLRVLQSDARIDLLITDVGLPGGMNGRQVADAARVLRPGLKVLFITGYAENAAVGNGHLEPGMQVVTKPFAMAALGEKVREMIER